MYEERKSRRADETEEDGRDEAERKGGRNRERRGVRTEKLGRKVRAQDDGALARATDMRPSTSIEGGGREGWESSGFNGRTLPLPRRNLLCQASFVRSFVSLDPSSARLIFDDLYPKGATILSEESLLQSFLREGESARVNRIASLDRVERAIRLIEDVFFFSRILFSIGMENKVERERKALINVIVDYRKEY